MAVSTIDALYHSGSEKLTTSATGITVTGTVAATAYTGDGSNLTGVGSPSIDDNGNATAMTITSDENVLIGTTDINPYDNTTGSGIALRSSGAIYNAINNGTSLNLNRMGSDGIIAQFRQGGAAVGNIGSVSGVDLFVAGNRGAGQRYLLDNILPCNSTGSVTNGDIDLGTADYKYRDLFLGGGIYLGGGVAANKLEDYEEGTWTPTVAGVNNTPTFYNNSGKYVKVGRKVTIQYFQQTNSPPTFSNNNAVFRVTGIPFTCNGSGYSGSQGSMNSQSFHYNGSSNNQQTSGQVEPSVGNDGGLALSFSVTSSGGTRGQVISGAAASGYIIEATVTYFTDQ